MLSKVVKGIFYIFMTFLAFVVYGYLYGPMYGGRQYQRKAYFGEARLLLAQFKKDQDAYFKKYKKYEKSLHSSNQYEEYKKFKLGFNDVATVARHCPDCFFKETSYKIAAYGQYGTQDIVWAIDNSGNMALIKE